MAEKASAGRPPSPVQRPVPPVPPVAAARSDAAKGPEPQKGPDLASAASLQAAPVAQKRDGAAASSDPTLLREAPGSRDAAGGVDPQK